MARNTLRGDGLPREQTEGKAIVSNRTQRNIRLVDPDGNTQEIPMEVRDTRPDENGNYVDTELVNIVTDRAGNPLPEDPRSVLRSHSGLYITSPDQLAHCTSWLHPHGRNTNILIGQDGRLTPNGAICSHCDSWLGTIYIILTILAIGLILGIWKGAGVF